MEEVGFSVISVNGASSCLLTGTSFGCVKAATGPLLITKGKLLILTNAAASLV